MASPNKPWQQNTDGDRTLLSHSSLCKAIGHHFKLQGLRQGTPERKDQIFPFHRQRKRPHLPASLPTGLLSWLLSAHLPEGEGD